MSPMNDDSLMELFRTEVETQTATLTNALLALETATDSARSLKDLMRAAHSLKGAARIVRRNPAVQVAHAMEDCFVAAQKGERTITNSTVDLLLGGIDLLCRLARMEDAELQSWEANHQDQIDQFVESLTSNASAVAETSTPELLRQSDKQAAASVGPTPGDQSPRATEELESATESDRSVRVTADNLSRLMGLAGEGLMASRWLNGFGSRMLKQKRLQLSLNSALDKLRESGLETGSDERMASQFVDLHRIAGDCRQDLTDLLSDVDVFDRRFMSLSTRLYHEVLDCRMQPFRDGIAGLQRMVRDLARSQGKTVHLEIEGETTPVDRDILEKLKAPLDHLLRNAIDHGVESPVERQQAGKSPEAHVSLEALHSAGMLLITVADDGRGVDVESVRKAVADRGFTTRETIEAMSVDEVLEFLFLPGFSLKRTVSEISGRGVGLDVVQATVKSVGGRVRVSTALRAGTRFTLELPLTLSVIRTLLVEVCGEPYAFPLAHIHRAAKIPRDQIHLLEGREHFSMDDEQVGLVAAHQVMDLDVSPTPSSEISVVVLGNRSARYGIVVDRFLGERELVVRPLDQRLGKAKNISSAALMPDGSPVLIVDVADFIHSIEALATGRQLSTVGSEAIAGSSRARKRILVVDDSLTVRELERKLLDGHGYVVDVAVDGMDGWNAVRSGQYDLVITDVDMPRLDGIELLTFIRRDNRYRSLPVMIVSYKDRPEDRNRGLEAGADYYLTKASFHDETLIQVVKDLIGEAIA